MAETRARGFVGTAFAGVAAFAGAAGFAAAPGGGRVAGCGAEAGAAGFAAGEGAAAGLAAAGFAGAAAGAAAGFPGCEGGLLPEVGAAVAPSGVPQRAQNLNVAALSVLQLGHCLGGTLVPASRGAAGQGATTRGCDMVGASSSGSEAPQDMHEPTSVSLTAPHLGHSMRDL
jgi:hypothetical protein